MFIRIEGRAVWCSARFFQLMLGPKTLLSPAVGVGSKVSSLSLSLSLSLGQVRYLGAEVCPPRAVIAGTVPVRRSRCR